MPEFTIPDYIRQQATAAGVPPELALAVAEQESSFNPTALGQEIPDPTDRTKKVRAIGTFQFLPSTAQRLGIDPQDPVQNIQGGVKYLRELLDKHGDLPKVLAEYGGVVHDTKYVPGVLARIQKYAGQGSAGSAGQTTPTPPAAGSSTKHRVSGLPPEVGLPPPPVARQYGTNLPTPPPPAVPGPTSRLEEAAQIGGQVLSAFDPRERKGRRNLAAAAGGATAAALTGGIGVLPAIAGMTGAGLFAGAEESGEQLVEGIRTGKPEEAYQPGETAKAAGRAAVEEGVGAGVAGLARGVVTRVMSIPIAKQVATKINLQGQAVLSTLKSGLDDLTTTLKAATTTSRRTAGEGAAAVLRGPATRTFKDLGAAVEASAQSGPEVPVGPLKAKLQALAQEIAPPAAPGNDAMTLRGDVLSPELTASIRARNPDLVLPVGDHPIKGLLGDLQASIKDRDTISFAEAHRIKTLLDATVNWESPAKRMVERASKGTRQTLREAMGSVGHLPYEHATSAYEAAVPLIRKGYGQKLAAVAEIEPAKIIPMIKSKDPQQTAMLRSLLTDLPVAQGPAAAQQGKRAWDAIRHAWTYDRLIKGNPEELPDRLAKLDPDFVQEFFRHDPAGQQVFGNLTTLSDAFTVSRDVTNDLVEEFRQSTLNLETKGNAVERIGADLARLSFLGPQSFWGASSMMRLILERPTGKEFLRWATFNNNGATPLLAKVLTNPYPGTAVADLLRLFNRDHGLKEEPGLPPPSPTAAPDPVGSPPPALR